jgi:tetratricopeptide (TPR) repeat protein
MRPTGKPFAMKMVLSFSFLLLLFFSQNISAASTIQGFIYDKQRNYLPDIDVELLNDLYQMVKRTRSDSSGRYQFDGLSDGRYTIRVLAFRYDYIDQEVPLEIQTQNFISANGTQSGGVGFFPQDFQLLPKKGGLKDAELGVIFAQDIPKEAETAYKKGVDNLAKKKTTEGMTLLMEAIQKYDKYYAAYFRLGQEYFINGKYIEAFQFFKKASDINPKSATSWYYMGVSLNKLGKEYNKAAMTSLKQAATLAPASQVVFYMLGKVEREEGKYPEAEEHLLLAKKLSPIKVAEIHKELSQLYANDLKKFKEAADELELYLKASKLKGDEEKEVKDLIVKLREKAKTQASS